MGCLGEGNGFCSATVKNEENFEDLPTTGGRACESGIASDD